MRIITDSNITRRIFVKNAAALLGCAGVIGLVGCESDSDDDDTTGNMAEDETGQISGNHGHAVILTVAQQTAGAAVTLTLTIGDGHTHTVDLTADHITAIMAGAPVTVESTSDGGHSHTVTF